MYIKMKTPIILNPIKYAAIAGALSLTLLAGCKKYLEIPLPVNNINSTTAFVSDASVASVVTGNLIALNTDAAIFTLNTGYNTGFTTGLYTDELQNITTSSSSNSVFYADALTQAYTSAQWTGLYRNVYYVNLAIEGINTTSATLANKNQWLGESLVNRAMLYFYLVNLYGDVPVITSSAYKANNAVSRAPKAQVYQQIIADLQQAQALLSTGYRSGTSATTTDKARPNKAVATALLARVYLYTNDWANAEAQATVLINNSAYQLVTPDQTFVANSNETIWALPTPVGSGTTAVNTDYALYNNNMPSVITGTNTTSTYNVTAALSTSLVNAFENNDRRFTYWVRLVTQALPAAAYYFPNKYKSNVVNAEYEVMLRLAEQYLIRAEARAQQNNITGAQADLNAIRTRAGLGATTAATQSDLVTAITKERRIEFFAELGHRFFDLKRTGTIDAVMNVAAPLKGGTWASFKQLWPISAADILQDPNLTQTPGY
jgi:hypothetical protein